MYNWTKDPRTDPDGAEDELETAKLAATTPEARYQCSVRQIAIYRAVSQVTTEEAIAEFQRTTGSLFSVNNRGNMAVPATSSNSTFLPPTQQQGYAQQQAEVGQNDPDGDA